MKKVLILFLLIALAWRATAQETTSLADTILVGSVEKNCPGGFKGFEKYIYNNVHPSAIAYENNKSGTSYINFIVEPDGTVSNACAILSAGYGMDEEVIRVISKSNNWIPLTIDNKPVRCFCRAAVQFITDKNKRSTQIFVKRID